MKINIKKICIWLSIILSSVSVTAFISSFFNKSNKISINSNNDEHNIKDLLSSKNKITPILFFDKGKFFFNEMLIKVNLRNIMIECISNTSFFKYNNYKLDDISISLKYKLISGDEIIINPTYSFTNNNQKYSPFFIIKILN